MLCCAYLLLDFHLLERDDASDLRYITRCSGPFLSGLFIDLDVDFQLNWTMDSAQASLSDGSNEPGRETP